MGWLGACFAALPDPRTGNATRHDLLEVLTIALVASICGAESCVDFADFARDREALFRDFLKLEHGLPSHDTFSRLFRLLDPAAFAGCFAGFLDGLGEAGRGVLAIEGKTLRRSFVVPHRPRPWQSSPPLPARPGWSWVRWRFPAAATRSLPPAHCSACSISPACWSPAMPSTARSKPRDWSKNAAATGCSP